MPCWGAGDGTGGCCICCLLKIGIDGGGIPWESWLLVVTNLKKDTGNGEIGTQDPRQDDGKSVKAQKGGQRGFVKTAQSSESPSSHLPMKL